MRPTRRTAASLGALALAGVVAAIGVGPLFVSGADHLDAPTAASDKRIDLTDLYAFRSAGGTTIVMNVNPLTSPANTKGARFRGSALYEFKIDTNLDTSADIAYRVRFFRFRRLADGAAVQDYIVKRATGAAARRHEWTGTTVASGRTTAYGRGVLVASVLGGGKAFAGPRDDPFFFDLPGFVTFKTELLMGTTDLGVLLGGFTAADTFAGTNVSSIALEVPNARLGGTGNTVGVWATTSVLTSTGYRQVERMGRPAINTIFNTTKAEKEADNRLSPSDDVATYHDNVVAVFKAVGGVLTANGATPYTDAEIEALAGVLLPDELTIKLGDPAGFLNGRRLANDVVDTAFAILTNGVITTGDGVNSNDKAFRTTFPYLAGPQ